MEQADGRRQVGEEARLRSEVEMLRTTLAVAQMVGVRVIGL